MGLPAGFTLPDPGWIAANSANWVPDIFSKKLQAKFYKASVLEKITNNEYEGDISGPGSKVIIRTVPSIAVSDYNGVVTYADVETSNIELLIDKAKFWSFKKDDVLASMADVPFWSEAAKDAAESMRVAVETDVLGGVVAGASNSVDSVAVQVTKDNILNYILEAGRKLDEDNIPEDRFLVLPPWAIEKLKLSDLKNAYLTGDGTSPLRNGKVGMIDRFTVYASNMLAAGAGGDAGKTLCLAGHKKAICFASKFVKTETVRLESTFGEGVRGLKVYGYKVVVPDALCAVKLLA